MHPFKDIGLQILDYLSRTEVLPSEVRPQKIEFGYPPTGAELFEDLITHSKFFNHLIVCGGLLEQCAPDGRS